MPISIEEKGRERLAAEMDIVELARDLIKCASVTPTDAGALDVLQKALEPLGFVCHRLPFGTGAAGKVDNIYARLGSESPNFCYAGHTDVVPPGRIADWSHAPFDASIEDGLIYGRGAADMKGAIAAFVGAIKRFQTQCAKGGMRIPGSISLLITGDEEGVAVNGTKRVLDWLEAKGEDIDHCLVGEPTNPEQIGDIVKIGRRGSLNAQITVKGVQGHVAYPDAADNPIRRLVKTLMALTDHPLDTGNENFQPSNLEITSVDTGNETTSIIPATASGRFNIRFNNCHDGTSLT